jgi:hypothetical protein
MNELYNDGIEFDFKTFPELELVFWELETKLKMHITLDTKPNRGTTVPENLPSQEAVEENWFKLAQRFLDQ